MGHMSESTPQRPRQVSFAAWMIMVGSIFVVLTAFEQVGSLRSLDTREAVQDFLATPPGDGLGLGVDTVLNGWRVLSLVAAGCATAAAILGFYVLQRSRSARIGLSVLALPLFVAGVSGGGLVSSLVVASSLLLWLQPARDWFGGVNRPTPAPIATPAPTPVAQPQPTRPQPQPQAQQPVRQPVRPPGGDQPPPYAGFGSAGAVPHPGATPVAQPAVRRPVPVVWAAVLTWACCGIVLVGMTLTVLVMAISPEILFEQLRRQQPDLADQGITEAALRTATMVTAVVLALWAAAAAVLAVLVWRRVPWARTALIGSAAASAVLLVLATVGNALLGLPLLASVACVVLLVRSDVRAWFVERPPTP